MNKETILEAINEWKYEKEHDWVVTTEEKMIFIFEEVFIPMFKELTVAFLKEAVKESSGSSSWNISERVVDGEQLKKRIEDMDTAIKEIKNYYIEKIKEL